MELASELSGSPEVLLQSGQAGQKEARRNQNRSGLRSEGGHHAAADILNVTNTCNAVISGRTLAFQEPAGFISADTFDSISEFLIPKPQLCGQLLVLRDEGRVVLAWPICLEDTRYARNALLFSIGFVLESGCASSAPERFGRLLAKASRQLEVLERESRAS